MNAKSLLDQLLQSGRSMLESGGGTATQGLGAGLPGGFGGGALMGGALGLLLGNKRIQKMGGGLLGYGGMAALGALAYKAYNDWQQANAGGGGPAPAAASFAQLPASEVEEHSRAVLQALVAAAKSDGHIDERERGLIEAEIGRLDNDPELRTWLDQELRKPLDPAEVARAARSPEMGAEMYLASVLAVDETSYMERSYLDELARQLRLEPGLKARLEAQAREGQ